MSGRIIVITGASGGLGPAVVTAFLESGDTVCGVSRSGMTRPESSFLDLRADLSSATGAHEVVAEILRRYERIDALVHVLGGYAGSPLGETDDVVWQRMFDLNVTSAFRVVREVLPYMRRAGSGRIVAIGSRAGEQFSANMAAYSSSKAALHAFIRSVAAELRDTGITANVVLPSTIDTPANRSWASKEQVANWVQPESIAKVVLWLCSDAALDVNGALVPVYGKA